jgi:hypothetical protein
MLTAADLRTIAQARIDDANVLFTSSRFDGAGYICGYAIELALKARICDTLNWPGYPANSNEFKNLQSFKTHNLDVLLSLSGREQTIKQNNFADWSIVCAWNPEARYSTIGAITSADAMAFIASTNTLLPLI